MRDSKREYLEMTVQQITKYLKDDLLNVESEDRTLEIALDWVKHDLGKRTPHLGALLSTVRFGLMPSRYRYNREAERIILKNAVPNRLYIHGAYSLASVKAMQQKRFDLRKGFYFIA